MNNKDAIILFTRVPIAGKTKTRLMPCYTPDECAQLHISFLQDIVAQALMTKKDVFICYEESGQDALLFDLFPSFDTFFPQRGKGIGERMAHAFEDVFAQGYRNCVLVGADIPELQANHFLTAFSALSNKDVVFGATVDGGYCLISMKNLIKEAFADIKYGSGDVLQNTVHYLENANYRTEVIFKLNDIDTPTDVLHLRERICNKADRSNTAEYLCQNPKISVIIPTYNESSTLLDLQDELDKLQNCEIIFVDGGSTDTTVDILQKLSSKYRVLTSPKGRANQMNTGAKIASGELFFFLHCDSTLPQNIEQELKTMALSQSWGAFNLQFDCDDFLMRCCGIMSNRRLKKDGIAFGDQGIFIPRALFFEVGGFPEIPIMEDYQLSLTLKEYGKKPTIANTCITTSARRFEGNAMKKLKLMYTMQKLRRLYLRGMSADEIAKQYADIRKGQG